MISASRMISLCGIKNIYNELLAHSSRYSLFSFVYGKWPVCWFLLHLRREQLWPELDKLLRDEDDSTSVSTPYTAAVLEYRVVFYDAADVSGGDKRWAFANGHAVYDAQHPCRYLWNDYLGFEFVQFFAPTCLTYGIIAAGQMWQWERSFILLHQTGHASIWSLIFLALDWRKLSWLIISFSEYRFLLLAKNLY